MIAEDLVRDRSVHCMIRFVLVVIVSFAVEIIRNEAAKVGEFVDNFYGFSIGVDSEVNCSSGKRLDEYLRLFYLICIHLEGFVGIVIQIYRQSRLQLHFHHHTKTFARRW